MGVVFRHQASPTNIFPATHHNFIFRLNSVHCVASSCYQALKVRVTATPQRSSTTTAAPQHNRSQHNSTACERTNATQKRRSTK